ncbi:hypothetical protein A4G29_22805 [Mycobacterium kansasii]|nr:hypothetical protein A4G29_22805 [Mycobacterium kansasii]
MRNARSPQQREVRAFTTPEQLNHRRYEALRAFFVDGLSYAEAGPWLTLEIADRTGRYADS